MSNKQLPIIIAIAVVVILGLLYFFGGNGRSYNWVEHYRPNSKDPYGTYLVHELLKNYFPAGKMEVLSDTLPAGEGDSLANYVFIGSNLWLDSAEMNQLLRFVERGNDAFVACSVMPLVLLDSIGQGQCTDLTYLRDSVYFEELDYFLQDSSVALNLLHDDLRGNEGYPYTFQLRSEAADYSWEYLPDDLFCEGQSVLAPLGQLNEVEVNFAKASYGKGHFYLHTTPLAFTNFNLLEPAGLDYAEKVFSHLSPRPIYWGRIRGGGGSGGGRRGFGESPLRYILSQPALRWAWYTLLGMAVLYLVFKAKRRQRIIPVLEKNENTSLEFINTIGRLYFLQNNHRQLSLQKMKLFLGYVRERYHLPTKELDGNFQQQLALRSEVPQEVIKKIVTIHGNIKNSQYSSENTLVELHRAMEFFYQNCK